MASEDDFSNRYWFKKIEKAISILANIAVISGIIFAFAQIMQSNNFEKRRISIEAVSQTRSNDFLKAYTRLITAYRSKKVEDQTSLIDDLNYVMNVYDTIAILYISELADKCIIKDTVYPDTKELSPILDVMSYPNEYRKHFDALLGFMEKEVCKQNTSTFK
jgi:hypothetical protein